MNELRYKLSVILLYADLILATVLILLVTAGSALFGGIMPASFQNHKAFFLILAVILIALVPVITKWLKTERQKAKYDEFGRLKSMNQYDDLAVREQKELDRIRMIENERLLPSTQIRQFTKAGSKDPDADIKKLIGLSDIKQQLEEIEARAEFSAENKKDKTDTNHMVFFGPPGTGKTTCAAIVTGVLYKAKIIKKNFMIDVSGSFFTDPEGPQKMEAIIQRSYGGVLFIDEAYALSYNQYGLDAVAQLIKAMEDNRGYFVLILAGYEDEMRALLQANPGFLSRIQKALFFHDYSTKELGMIFRQMAAGHGMKITKDAMQKFYRCVEEAKQSKNFGNARTCRSILDQSISRHAYRLKKKKTERVNVLEMEDIVYEPNRLAM
jgi:stage V sporulation protein K